MRTPTYEEIQAVCAATDMVELARENIHGELTHYRGESYRGECPFHEDHRARSFYVNAKRQQYYCFACQRGGDAIRFVMDLRHVELTDAIRALLVRDTKDD